ncbi:MAG: type IVB secretion system protein IcmV [Proteobacteria bacterium]|nr:type IVB secretion system protein IcmV [Pseudomonadota bacterium]
MGAIKVTKKVLAMGWNFSRWVGIGELKKNTQMIKNMAARNLSAKAKNADFKAENFEQLMKHYQMTEADLKKRVHSCNQIMIFCSLFSVLTIAYTIFIFQHHLYLGGLVGILMTLLLWAYVFREHYTKFQIQQRRLKCTIQEWFAHTIGVKLPGDKK